MIIIGWIGIGEGILLLCVLFGFFLIAALGWLD